MRTTAVHVFLIRKFKVEYNSRCDLKVHLEDRVKDAGAERTEFFTRLFWLQNPLNPGMRRQGWMSARG